MPTIHILDSIKIDVYSREHPPPHFHALFAEYEILIDMGTLETYAGTFPKKQHKAVLDWASDIHVRKLLLNTFNALNPDLRK